ncbi:phage tail tip lysozyme [Devosia sp.]|uniref:phage tail tip lysozyme n=1 Tax=Devosia sp. TaxID=1871048 RepID=UPI001B095FF4|nr:phage tail tip lysozyme [Devosia sp.]MBO9589451.1 hypothetical protein [Devosia sp.]
MANQHTSTALSFFKSRGYTDAQAAGIVGNLLGESGLNVSAIGDGGKARGVAQWHPDRWGALTSGPFAGRNHYDLSTQLEMVDWELRNKETRAFNSLMAAKTVDEATAAFIGFERPLGFTWDNPRGGHNYSGRLGFAQQAFGITGGSNAPAPAIVSHEPAVGTPFSITGDGANSAYATDAPLAPPPTYADQRAAEAAKPAPPSMFDGIGAAVQEEWSLSWLMRGSPTGPMDLDYRMTQADFDTFTKDIPEQYWDRFDGVHSQQHGMAIRESLAKTLENDQTLADMGGMGMALRLGAGFTDPGAWIAGLGAAAVTGGAGGAFVAGQKISRAGNALRMAGIGAASNLATDSIIWANKQTSENTDLLWSAGLGAVLGGSFGAFARNPHVTAESAMLEKAGRNLMNGTALNRNSSAGAMYAGSKTPLDFSADEIIRDLGDTAAPRSVNLGNTRFDVANKGKSSDNPLTRAITNVLYEDATRNADGVTPIAVTEMQSRLQRQAETKWRSAYEPAFKQYLKDNSIGFWERDRARLEFSEAVADFVDNQNPLRVFEPSVTAAGEQFRKIMGDWQEMLHNPGIITGTVKRSVRGAETLQKNPQYIPRIPDKGKVRDALNAFGQDRLVGALVMAMKEKTPNLADDVAHRVATGYIKKMHSLSAGEAANLQRVFSGEDMDGLRELLTDYSGVSGDDLDNLMKNIHAEFQRKPQNGAASRLKSRLLFNEHFTVKLQTINGEVRDFAMKHLFNRDADALMSSYTRQVSGRVAMGNLSIRNPKWQAGDEVAENIVNGVTSDAEWRKVLEQVRAVGDTAAPERIEADLRLLDHGYNTVVGRSRWDEGSTFNQFLRVFRDYNFLRVFGQAGLASLSEFGNIASQVGVKAMLSSIPPMRALWRNARTGKMGEQLAQEIEDHLGIGTDWLRNLPRTHRDDFGNPLDGINNNPVFNAVDATLSKGKRLLSAASGLAPINTTLQRIAGRAIFTKFAAMAMGDTAMSGKRLLALGLDDAMTERVFESIRNNAEFHPGSNRLAGMNFDRWDDQEALAAFEGAAYRLARTMVQENDPGQFAVWMSHPLARTLLQFRSFTIGAWSKQLHQGLNMRDRTTAMQWISTTFLASMVYTARTYANSIGRSDQQEYLEKRLSVQAIAAGGIQNSNFFSLLAPAIDTAMKATGNAPIFIGRNTQQASDIWGGIPTVDLYNSVSEGLAAAFQAGTKGGLSQTDVRSMLRVLPFQNAMGVTQMFNGMVRGLPEWTKRD